MQNTDITKINALPNEVKINLNVFGMLMLNWVGGHVNCADVVTIDQRGTAQGSMELL